VLGKNPNLDSRYGYSHFERICELYDHVDCFISACYALICSPPCSLMHDLMALASARSTLTGWNPTSLTASACSSFLDDSKDLESGIFRIGMGFDRGSIEDLAPAIGVDRRRHSLKQGRKK